MTRDGALVRGQEAALRCEHFPPPLQFRFHRTDARCLNLVEDELVTAARFVKRCPPVYAHGNAVGKIARRQAQAESAAAKEGAGDLGIAVFQGKIDMPGRGAAEVGNLAFHPKIAEITFEQAAHMGVELADGVGEAHAAAMKRAMMQSRLTPKSAERASDLSWI